MKDFKSIIDQYHPVLYKISRSYTDNDFDFKDLYQEMLIQIWQSLKKFKGESKLSTWLYRIALNTALTHVRKKKPQKVPIQEIQHALVEKDGREIEMVQNKKIQLLYECIRLLDKQDRSLILLHLEGNSYEEMAEIIGISMSNVGVKLMRIRKKLFKLLKEKGYGRI